MPCIEIGGNFCLTQHQIDSFGHNHHCDDYATDFWGWDHVVFTHSGRSAITTSVQHLGLSGREVLVPNFSCHSITDAFLSCNCKVGYYPINRDDLSVNQTILMRLIEEHQPAILYTCPYFGFDTLSSMRSLYKDIQAKGIIIIEDVTHSLLSSFNSKTANVVVCSLRKWLEIPDGGFIWGLEDFDNEGFYRTHSEETSIVKNFLYASKLKLDFFKTENEGLKTVFLPIFYKNNEIFNNARQRYRMSTFSHEILLHADFGQIIERRRANYNYLLNHLKNPLVEVIFSSLPAEIVPLYMQIYVHKGQRTPLQQALVQERLYCPIIWPTPMSVLTACLNEDVQFHEDMLSLVIDQRYDLQDMERLVQNINNFR